MRWRGNAANRAAHDAGHYPQKPHATLTPPPWGRRSGFHTRKVIWTLQELDLPFDLIEAGHGIVPTAEFTARNPNTLAPVIDEGGIIVWESNVIVRYLCARYSAGRLFPDADLQARFRAKQWMDWNATTLWPALRPICHDATRGGSLPAADRESRIGEIGRWLNVMEQQLGVTAYLAGDAFTMADIPAALSIDRWFALGPDDGTRPRLRRWWSNVIARPAFPKPAFPKMD